MPPSPLIRPLSPLQTQSAPSLPAPYNLADAILGTRPTAAWHASAIPSSTPSIQRRCSASSSSDRDSEGGRQHTSPSQRAASPIGVGTSAELEARGSVGVNADNAKSASSMDRGSSLIHEGSAATCVGLHPSRAMSATPSFTAPERARASTRPAWETTDQIIDRHEHQPRTTPPPTARVLTTSSLCGLGGVHASSATATAKAATLMPSSSSHPYEEASPTHPQRNTRGGASHHESEAASGIVHHLRSHHAQARPSTSAATLLLHSSTAGVAVAAAQPSYGEPLLQRVALGRGCKGFERRSPSPPRLAESHEEARVRAAHHTHFLSNSKTGLTDDAASSFSMVGCTTDERDALVLRAPASAVDAAATHYQGTAVSSRTGRLYNISIEASLLEKNSPRSSSASPEQKVKSHTIASVLRATTTRDTLGSALDDDDNNNTAASTSDEDSPKTVETAPASEDGDDMGFEGSQPSPAACVHSTDLTAGHDTEKSTAASRTRRPSPSVPSFCASPPLRCPSKLTTPASTAPPPSASCASRYVYPALDDCQRLLREIQVQNPLLRRCLTPPRPLASSPSAAAASIVEPTEAAGAAVPATSSSSSSPPFAGGVAGRLIPGPEARRLYRWDPSAAAEDLSCTHGPFQQSAERFAASTARQLQRLQETGKRLYSADGAMKSTSESWLRASTRHLSEGAPLTSCSRASWPLDGVSGSAGFDGDAVESPSARLRRLLQETEAVFPVLWSSTHPPSMPSPRASEARGSSVPGSGSAVITTPSPSVIQPSRGGRAGALGELNDSTSAKGPRSDLTCSRLNEPSAVLSDELPWGFTIAAMTPARPPVAHPAAPSGSRDAAR